MILQIRWVYRPLIPAECFWQINPNLCKYCGDINCYMRNSLKANPKTILCKIIIYRKQQFESLQNLIQFIILSIPLSSTSLENLLVSIDRHLI